MALKTDALTTMSTVRLYLGLFTSTQVTSTETLTADTASTTFSFTNTDIQPNRFGTFAEVSGTASDTVSTAVMTINYSLGTVTFSAARTGSITISSYYYNAWDYSNDLLIERLINSACEQVEKYCDRKFIANTYTEYHKGVGRQKLLVKQFPINAITSVKVNSASLTAGTDYVTADSTYLNQGIIFKNTGWTFYGYLTGLVGEPTAPLDNIEVIYSAGYTLATDSTRTLPYDIEDAVVTLVSMQYEIKGSKHLKVETIGPLSSTFATDMPYDVIRTLDKYKKRCC